MAPRAAALLAAALLLGAAPSRAQQRAAVEGRVVDASGAPIGEAEVVALDAPGRAISAADGRFRLALAGGGPVRVRVRRLGYAAREARLEPGATPVIRLTPLPVALDAFVVTAARREQRLKDAVVETELVSRDAIARTGAGDVAAVLTEQTGVQLDGGVPAGAGVALQGVGSQRVLILLDGQPLVGRVNGNLDVSRLPVSLVERVEVVRGPQSTLYGSEAMGGVINIITRTPPADGVDVRAAVVGGSRDRREVYGAVRAARGRSGVGVDAGWRSIALAPGISGDAGTLARRWHAAPRLIWRGGAVSLDASGLVIGERQRYRVGQLFFFGDNVQLGSRLAATWRRGRTEIAPVLSWSSFDHLSRAATTDRPASDSGARDVQRLLQAEVVAHTPLAAGYADAGLALRREAILADRVPGGTRVLHGAEPYAQVTWNIGPVALTPGARLSVHEQWGTALTPRLAALWRPVDAVGVRAAVGRGYRAPDFKELYLEFVNSAVGYSVRGNPDLTPEHSTNYSLGLELVGARSWARLSGYHNRYRDFIETGEQDAGGTFSYENVAEGITQGFEVESGVDLGRSRFEAGYAFLDTEDGRTGTPLLGRARHSARAGFGAGAGPIRLSATALYTGRTPTRRDSSGAIVETRAAFTRVDLRLTADLPAAFELQAGVDNVFDRRMGNAWPGFTGRMVYVGVGYQEREE
jgi:outer membrane receptor for ferrienterochelin and colicins